MRQPGHISNSGMRVRISDAIPAQGLRRVQGPRRRYVSIALCGFILALALGFSSQASAKPILSFKEDFGSAGHPGFTSPTALAVDQSTGDVLVMDQPAGTISRFKPNGAPDNFSALGTNVIDKAGTQGLQFGGASESEIAIDDSGTATDGDIYVTPGSPNVIDVFAGSGAYLGQLSESTSGPFTEACGVTADSAGSVFVGDYRGNLGGTIDEFSPSANPVTNGDSTTSFHEPIDPCILAAGAGASAGSLFALDYNGPLFKLNASSGAVAYTVSAGEGTTAAVDPETGNVLEGTGNEIVEYDASGASAAVQTASFTAESAVKGLAVGPSGTVYLSRSGSSELEVLSHRTVASVTAKAATGVGQNGATLHGAVDPEGLEVTECKFEYGPASGSTFESSVPCNPSAASLGADSVSHPVSAVVAGLQPNTAYHFRVTASDTNGPQSSNALTLTTPGLPYVTDSPPTGVGQNGATLHGSVDPEGLEVTECKFEYGPASSSTLERSAPCNPPAASLEADSIAHPVSAVIGGLQPNTAYHVRISASNQSGTRDGEVLTFTTSGPPQISEIRALEASQDSVTLEAKINPGGSGTSYRFEWGATETYGHSIPAEFETYVGEGEKPVLVTAKLSSLSVGATYHYRLTAHNTAGTTTSPDEVLETLDSCGLPDQRCLELVSPPDPGPVAQPGVYSNEELGFQAASAPGGLVYSVANGLPGTTKAAEVLYHAERGASGWSSTQFGAPIVGRTELTGPASRTSVTLGISTGLSCAVVASDQPLTSDPAPRLVEEAGGSNLYRRNPDGTYTAITSLAPENFTETGIGFVDEGYRLVGFSENCSKVVFASTYRYPGVPAIQAGGEALYEWDEGTLRSVGYVPDSGGETAVGATQGKIFNAVSEDGARVFFSAERQLSANAEEVGKTGLFVREDGRKTRDLSLSETSTPDLGATYRWITPDGSRVFFTANAGLTHVSSSEGTDLYEYNLESNRLTDLSATNQSGGAEASYMLGTSSDGAHVYFEARGQLVPGQGRTLAENNEQGTYSIYGEKDGVLSYVGFGVTEIGTLNGVAENAEVSPDGRYLLFETTADETGYVSGGPAEAYLYDADAATDPTVCVSCRQSGEASIAPSLNSPLPTFGGATDHLHREKHLAVRNGQALVFFVSVDDLAPGAIVGDVNLYEWAHGQVFRITTEPPGLHVVAQDGTEGVVQFVGANSDGTDLYFRTPSSLTWEQQYEGYGVYDARAGGGFPEPPAPPAGCDPNSEASCQVASSQSPPSLGASSALLNGPGNVSPGSTKPSVPAPKALTRAQKLAKALKACHVYKAKSKRSQCEKRARNTYSNKPKAKAKSHKTAKPRKGGK